MNDDDAGCIGGLMARSGAAGCIGGLMARKGTPGCIGGLIARSGAAGFNGGLMIRSGAADPSERSSSLVTDDNESRSLECDNGAPLDLDGGGPILEGVAPCLVGLYRGDLAGRGGGDGELMG